MPNPHFRVNHISRGAGQNAVASAAYRAAETLYDYRSPLDAAAYQAGETLTDDKRGEVYSFVRKEGVLAKEIYAPGDAPEWARDREKLWNAVERAEDSSTRRASARLAVDFVGSLPRELSHEEHRVIVARFVQDQFTRRGLVADVSFHSVKARDGGQNPHVHMMVTTREIGPDGFGAKARWMDKKETLTRWRSSWEHHTNRLLEAAGRDERLSLRSLTAQGIDRTPTKALGYEASALEKKGIRTTRGDENRRIAADNALRDERRRQEQADTNGDGRGAWFDSFSYGFGGSLDAARDAVHRFRQKDAEKGEGVSDDKGGSLSERLRASGAILDQKISEAEKASEKATASTPPPAPAPAREQTAAGSSLEAALQNERQAWAKAGVKDLGSATGADYFNGISSGVYQSAEQQSAGAQRGMSRTLDGNDSPRGPYAPPPGRPTEQTPPPASVTVQEQTTVAASVSAGTTATAEQSRAVNLQQTPATMQPGATKATTTQQEAQHQGATVGGREQQAANAFFDQHGGKVGTADKNLSKQKDQTQELDR